MFIFGFFILSVILFINFKLTFIRFYSINFINFVYPSNKFNCFFNYFVHKFAASRNLFWSGKRNNSHGRSSKSKDEPSLTYVLSFDFFVSLKLTLPRFAFATRNQDIKAVFRDTCCLSLFRVSAFVSEAVGAQVPLKNRPQAFERHSEDKEALELDQGFQNCGLRTNGDPWRLHKKSAIR